jgi:hypothetical protein
MLHSIYSAGIKAYCSDLIVHPYERELAVFLSISGHQTAIKGIIANFLERNTLKLVHDCNHHYIRRADFNYTYRLKKLPSGMVHAIILPIHALPRNEEEKRNSFYLLTREHDNIPLLFFRYLDNLTDIPLHESWALWLWELFTSMDNWLIGLETLVGDYKGFMVEFNAMQLQEKIAEAFSSRIPEILNCMERSL